MNLLTNAIEYNHPGGTVELHCESNDNGLSLSVRDSGQGISPEALPHVFEPFYRADKQRPRATPSTWAWACSSSSHTSKR
jgi:signal transduction histidine kinase